VKAALEELGIARRLGPVESESEARPEVCGSVRKAPSSGRGFESEASEQHQIARAPAAITGDPRWSAVTARVRADGGLFIR
jgi:hypothetical protein